MFSSGFRSNIKYAFMLVTTLLVMGILAYGARESMVNGPKAITMLQQKQEVEKALLPLGMEAPNFILPGIDGKDYQLQSYRGKKLVLVELYASWCPHCQESVDSLKYLYQKSSKKMEILAINAGDKPPQRSTSKEFQAAYAIPYPILEEPSDTLMTAYRLEGFPTLYLVDKQGKIIFAHTGALHPDEAKEIETLVAKNF